MAVPPFAEVSPVALVVLVAAPPSPPVLVFVAEPVVVVGDPLPLLRWLACATSTVAPLSADPLLEPFPPWTSPSLTAVVPTASPPLLWTGASTVVAAEPSSALLVATTSSAEATA